MVINDEIKVQLYEELKVFTQFIVIITREQMVSRILFLKYKNKKETEDIIDITRHYVLSEKRGV